MDFRINLRLIILVSLVYIASGQLAATAAEQTSPPAQSPQSTTPSLPYIAQITSDNLYIRSGPGTQYYNCGKLNHTDRVKVVGTRFSWAQIVPPTGCFSWISKQYVRIDPNNAAVGFVTGDNIRVYAGSENLKPIHSTTLQMKLDKADKVVLTGEEKDTYYKILPPSGAYLWVSSQYVEPLGPAAEIPFTAEIRTKPDEPAAEPNLSTEEKFIRDYYALQEQLKKQRSEPVAQQDYSDIKKALEKITNNKTAGKAARYSKFTLQQIERYELALKAEKQLKLQNSRLQEIQQNIDKARRKKLKSIPQLGRFAAIGRFKTSNIYTSAAHIKRYRIVDDSGKTTCYAVLQGPVQDLDLTRFIDKKVGLVGTIQPNPQTAGALVRFTEITEIKSVQEY